MKPLKLSGRKIAVPMDANPRDIEDTGDPRHPETLRKQRHDRCADCGEWGERAGHMGCQYPQDR